MDLRTSPTASLSVLDLARLHGDALASLLLLIAVLSLTPLVGVSLLLLPIAWRWREGDGAVPIPERLGNLQLNACWSGRCERGLRWLHDQARRWLRARWTILLSPATRSGWSLWIATMGVLSLLPLPLMNVLPAFSLVLLSLGWMHRDGMALAVSVAVGAAGIGYVALMGHWIAAMARSTLDAARSFLAS